VLNELVVGEIMLWYHRLAVMSFKYKLEFDLSLWNIHDNIRFIESHNRVCPDKPLPFEHNLLLREELPEEFYLFDIDKYNL